MISSDDMIEVQNVNAPDWTGRLNRAKYMAMRDALLPVLPEEAPGISVAQAKAALLATLSDQHFPGGEKAGWWLKAVQLDLEAKGIISRAPKSPVRLYRTGNPPKT